MTAEDFADQVHDATLGYFQILSMYLGLRLQLYEALRDGPLTADALAGLAAIDARYAREWCEQQASAGVLHADVTNEPHMFRRSDDAAESLLDTDSLSYLGATIRQLASLRAVIDPVVEAYRTGDGVPAEAFGTESADGQGGSNRRCTCARSRTTGCRTSSPSTRSSRPVPRRSSTSDAATGGRRSGSHAHTPMRQSTVTTLTRIRSSRRTSMRPKRASRTAGGSTLWGPPRSS